jgi:leader peptidase (prepilin peptidase)/N-methyltransferase
LNYLIAGAFGFLAALAAHDLAVASLGDGSMLPFTGVCRQCNTRRGWLRVACPSCGRRVGRELIVIVVGVAGALAFFNTIQSGWVLVAYGGFLTLSLALALTDIDAMRIVDRLNLPGTLAILILLGVGSAIDGSLDSYWRGLLGGLAYFVGTNLMFILVRGRGFGYGDVKLSIQLGVFTAYLSWGTLGWAVFGTALIGGVLSVIVLVVASATKRKPTVADPDDTQGMKEAMQIELPYGPAMIAGAWLAVYLAGIGAFPLPT